MIQAASWPGVSNTLAFEVTDRGVSGGGSGATRALGGRIVVPGRLLAPPPRLPLLGGLPLLPVGVDPAQHGHAGPARGFVVIAGNGQVGQLPQDVVDAHGHVVLAQLPGHQFPAFQLLVEPARVHELFEPRGGNLELGLYLVGIKAPYDQIEHLLPRCHAIVLSSVRAGNPPGPAVMGNPHIQMLSIYITTFPEKSRKIRPEC